VKPEEEIRRCGDCGFVGPRDAYIAHSCYWELRRRGEEAATKAAEEREKGESRG
jgi:hypothetical protein